MPDKTQAPRAIAIAMDAHAGQVDHAGLPILSHVLRVAAAVAHLGDDAITVAMLHDVVEDSNGRVTVTDIQRQFGARIATEVAVLTHAGGDYLDYVRRIAKHGGLALAVKRADNLDNSRVDRLDMLPKDKSAHLRMRYAAAAVLLFAPGT